MAWTPFTRLDHDRRGQRYTSDLTDAEYALILPYLARISHQDRVVIAPGGVDPLGEGRKA